MPTAQFQPTTEPTPPPLEARVGSGHPTTIAGALASCLLCVISGAGNAEPVTWLPSSSGPTNRVSDDLELALRARKIVLEDEVLAGLMLGISVRNRVAILWGRVPSASAAQHAEECLRNLPGLMAIRNELNIDAGAEDKANRKLPSRAQSRTLSSQGRSPEARPGQGALAHRSGEQVPQQKQEHLWRPTVSARPKVLRPQAPERRVDAEGIREQPSAECLPGFPVRDSTVTPSLSAATKAPQPPFRTPEPTGVIATIILPPALALGDSAQTTLPSLPAGPQHTDPSLAQAIEALRLADDRFRGVRIEVGGETVYLRGTVYRWEHLFELARSISRLPGVKRVLFQDVQAESSFDR